MATNSSSASEQNNSPNWFKWANSLAGYAAVIVAVIGFFWAQKALSDNDERIKKLDKKADDVTAKVTPIEAQVAKAEKGVKDLSLDVDKKGDELKAKVDSYKKQLDEIDLKAKQLSLLVKYLEDKAFLEKVLKVF